MINKYSFLTNVEKHNAVVIMQLVECKVES